MPQTATLANEQGNDDVISMGEEETENSARNLF